MKFPGIAAGAAERADDGAVGAAHSCHDVVGAVNQNDIILLRIEWRSPFRAASRVALQRPVGG
jgi:hypothetical protein